MISTAVKREGAGPELLATAVDLMTTLNAGARDAGRALGDAVHGATDVTGFGLLGHLGELARGSGVGARIERAAVPVIDGVPALVRDGFVAGGTQRNHAFVSEFVDWGNTTEDDQLLLADAQTSGGLLFAVAPDAADALVAGLTAAGTPAAARIGQLTSDPPGSVAIV
jgi:selenide,water dikinase